MFGEKLFLACAPRISHRFIVMWNSAYWMGRVGQSVHLFLRYGASNFVGVAGTKIQHSGGTGALAYFFRHLLVAGPPGAFKDSIPVTG